jgi:hypothetical protein
MLPKWTAIYVRDDDDEKEKTIQVYAETIFQAWYNAMSIIQILEKTEDYSIKSVNPSKTS